MHLFSLVFHFFTVQFLNPGDTFSGTVHFDTCASLPDHPGSVVITASAGNAIKASIITQVGGQVRSWKASGFFYYPSRQLLLAKEGYNSRDLNLICNFPESDNAAQCQILRDNFGSNCGTFNLERDYTGELSHVNL